MPTAILSVYDKSGIIEFAQGLVSLGWNLLASGGTAQVLRDNGIEAMEVSDYTKSPEILGGRVKTLHPAIHGGLLARSNDSDRRELQRFGWDYIDLVAVNLYPFEATLTKPNVTHEDIIENIDIGGVTLIRAAAKNYERVITVCDPADYAEVHSALRQGELVSAKRKQLALKGFQVTAHYDTMIAEYFKPR
jgi:phosphoribosylaminoimidazolecarboxamide formyltransferase/IMP cyclohydrolase